VTSHSGNAEGTGTRGTNGQYSVTNAHNAAAVDLFPVMNRGLAARPRLDAERRSDDSALIMTNRATVPWPWIWGVATVLSVFSGLQSQRFTALVTGRDQFDWRLMVLNFSLWYGPALMAPSIIRLTERFRFDRHSWWRALPIHAAAVLVFSVVHEAIMLGTRISLWEKVKPEKTSWSSFAQADFLRNFDSMMVVYWGIVGLTHAVIFYREAQTRALRTSHLETRLVESQLRALQQQLHPHFLFNSLHTVSALLHKDVEQADRMIAQLSDLLRITLQHGATQEILLHQELEFLEGYLAIEQTRFQDRLSVRYDIDPNLLDARVPSLILQPVVENAIKHGIASIAAPGLIEISARETGGQLLLEVRDNGTGLTAGGLEALQKGIGLSNTRARLQCLYGSDHRFEFSNTRGGLLVRIAIPMNTDGARPVAPPQEHTRVA
jgi:two-component system, LytTR family, sensor kinase